MHCYTIKLCHVCPGACFTTNYCSIHSFNPVEYKMFFHFFAVLFLFLRSFTPNAEHRSALLYQYYTVERLSIFKFHHINQRHQFIPTHTTSNNIFSAALVSTCLGLQLVLTMKTISTPKMLRIHIHSVTGLFQSQLQIAHFI